MSRFPKLTETFILYEMQTMKQLGIAIEIYPLLRHRERIRHPEVESLMSHVHYHPFLSLPILYSQWFFIRRSLLSYIKVFAEVLKGTFGSMNFFFGALGIFPKAVRFAYEMTNQGITHVHAHFATHPTVAALIIHQLTGIPFSFTAHGSDLHVERRMLDRKVEAAEFVVTCSSFNKEVIIRECGERIRDKIHIIHYGVEPEIFSLNSEKDSEGPFRIVCVGSFEEVKGHKYLIDACRILRDRKVEFECHLVGDGPQRRQIEKQITEYKLMDKIILHGNLRRKDVIKMLQTADVKVAPSVPTAEGKREGMPNVLIEAMAVGCPVVSTILSGIPELVETEYTGLLVPPRDVTSLVNSLERLSNDPELRLRLGKAGREKVMREYNRKNNTRVLMKLIIGGEDNSPIKTRKA